MSRFACLISLLCLAGCKNGNNGKADMGPDGSAGSCSDHTLNNGESDTDCGGPCNRCNDNQRCHDDGDCASGRCNNLRCATTINYAAPRSYPVGLSPSSAGLADLDGDGHLDLLFTGGDFNLQNTGLLGVKRGLGDGSFDTTTTYKVGYLPDGIATGDLSGDGKPDVAVANVFGGTISVLINGGNGNLGKIAAYDVGDQPVNVAIADFDGDGKPDVAVANQASQDVSLLLGSGDGKLGVQSRSPPIFGGRLRSIAAADFNGDGTFDVAVGDANTKNIHVLLGQHNGVFKAAVDYDAGSPTNSITAVDLDGDMKEDVVVCTTVGAAVFISRGDGTFNPAVRYTVGSSPITLAVADFNLDGTKDLALGDAYDPNSVHLLLGLGNGAFQPGNSAYYGPGAPFVVAGDLDGDMRPDLAVVNDATEDVTVLLTDPTASFPSPPRVPTGGSPRAIAAADLDGDGKADLVTADEQGPSVSVLLSAGDGTLKPAVTYPAPGTPSGLALADFDGDGKIDVAVSSLTGGVRLFLNGTAGALMPSLFLGGGGSTTSLVAADIDLDGKLDIATANRDVGDVRVLLNQGAGKFAPEKIFAAGEGAQSIVTGDFNGDGLADLAVASSSVGSKRVIVLLNAGSTTFSPAVPYDFAVDPNAYLASLAAGDFDGDGRTDLAAVVGDSTASSKCSVFLALDGGILAKPVLYPIGRSTKTLLAASIYGRARPDLIATSERGIGLLISNGDGTFKPVLTFRAGAIPWAAVPADLNGDNKPELAAIAATYPGLISILSNTSP